MQYFLQYYGFSPSHREVNCLAPSENWEKCCFVLLKVIAIYPLISSPFWKVFLDPVHFSTLLPVFYSLCMLLVRHSIFGWPSLLYIWNICTCVMTCYLLLLFICQFSSCPFFNLWLPFVTLILRNFHQLFQSIVFWYWP